MCLPCSSIYSTRMHLLTLLHWYLPPISRPLRRHPSATLSSPNRWLCQRRASCTLEETLFSSLYNCNYIHSFWFCIFYQVILTDVYLSFYTITHKVFFLSRKFRQTTAIFIQILDLHKARMGKTGLIAALKWGWQIFVQRRVKSRWSDRHSFVGSFLFESQASMRVYRWHICPSKYHSDG